MNTNLNIKTKTSHSCTCTITRGLEHLTRHLAAEYSSNTFFAVVDENVHRLHGKNIEQAFSKTQKKWHLYTLPEGETSKSEAEYLAICTFLLNRKVRRGSPLVAIGGGVTGDVTGFAAATTLRGIPLIHIPTTLLAMVDSSIGGKTGINHATGKNLLGSFYQPDFILQNLDFLSTLDEQEWINGISEMIKYAAIKHPEMADEISDVIHTSGFKPTDEWGALIVKSAQTKIEIVESDVKESGIRAYLNYGHTFAHALEKTAQYGTISHGQAVYIGMLAALYFGNKKGDNIHPEKLETFLELYTTNLSGLKHDKTYIESLVDAMKYDKKIKNDNIRLVLLSEFGKPYIHTVTNEQSVRKAWRYALSHFQ